MNYRKKFKTWFQVTQSFSSTFEKLKFHSHEHTREVSSSSWYKCFNRIKILINKIALTIKTLPLRASQRAILYIKKKKSRENSSLVTVSASGEGTVSNKFHVARLHCPLLWTRFLPGIAATRELRRIHSRCIQRASLARIFPTDYHVFHPRTPLSNFGELRNYEILGMWCSLGWQFLLFLSFISYL